MRKKPNWDDLWARLRRTFEAAGQKRNVAVLDNHRDSQEKILRKFGVISEADVGRISRSIRKSG